MRGQKWNFICCIRVIRCLCEGALKRFEAWSGLIRGAFRAYNNAIITFIRRDIYQAVAHSYFRASFDIKWSLILWHYLECGKFRKYAGVEEGNSARRKEGRVAGTSYILPLYRSSCWISSGIYTGFSLLLLGSKVESRLVKINMWPGGQLPLLCQIINNLTWSLSQIQSGLITVRYEIIILVLISIVQLFNVIIVFPKGSIYFFLPPRNRFHFQFQSFSGKTDLRVPEGSYQSYR